MLTRTVPKLVLGLGAIIAAFLSSLLMLDKSPGYDWSQYNAWTFVERSIVLAYNSFPLHNPWVCGGVDILANPQSHVFSPLIGLDLALPPEWANLAIIFLCAWAGFVGMARLLETRGVSSPTAMLGALLFITGNWFGLHFAAGHIAYGGLLLLPWIFLNASSIERRGPFIALCLLEVFFFLSGMMYAAVFSILLVLAMTVVGECKLWRAFGSSFKEGIFRFGFALASFFLASPKIIPMLSVFGDRKPWLEFETIPPKLLLQLFAYPFGTPATKISGLRYGYHEYGCYCSVLGLLLVVMTCLTRRRFFRENLGIVILGLMFLIIGAGWGGAANPWHLFQRIPLFNSAHVQSRLFLFTFSCFIILLAKSVDLLRRWQKVWLAVVVILAAEGITFHNYPIFQLLKASRIKAPTWALMNTHTVHPTAEDGWTIGHYLTGRGSRSCYDPAQAPTSVKVQGKPDYHGEAFVVHGDARAFLYEYVPGEVTVRIEQTGLPILAPKDVEVEVNTNWIAGWEVSDGKGSAFKGPNGLLHLNFAPSEFMLEAQYRPDYMPKVRWLFATGLLLFAILAFRVFREGISRRSEQSSRGYFPGPSNHPS